MPHDVHNEPDGVYRSFAVEIQESTGCAPDDVARVERVMRDEMGRGFENVSRAAFSSMARRCFNFLQELRALNANPSDSVDRLGWSRAEFDALVERYLKP